MNNTYQLSYDVFGTNITPTQLQAFLAESRKVASFHQPFAGTVFIKSTFYAADLRDSFKPLLGEAAFTINLMDASTVTGALNATVWQWIYSDDAGFARLVGNSRSPSLIAK